MVKGATREDRDRARIERSERNRIQHIRDRVAAARSGRELLVVATNVALAARKRISDAAQRGMAREIVQVVERWDIPENRKETS